jgi:AhpD family alkylhydroperoxidase
MEEALMQARIDSPALTVPGAMQALQRLGAAARHTGLSETTLCLVEMRASQINGCAVCLDMHAREMKNAGEPDERIFTLSA